MDRHLLLFTVSYPYLKAGEDSFLKHELPYLLKSFQSVTVIPTLVGGARAQLNKQIIVDESLAKHLEKRKSLSKKMFYGSRSRIIIYEIIKKPKLLFQLKKIIKLVLYTYRLKQIGKWFNASAYKNSKDLIIYTYWFTEITSFFALNKTAQIVITRVHGSDLYEERNNGYIPLREFSVSNLKAVYCVSEAGQQYLTAKFPKYSNKFKLSRLGVKSSRVGFDRLPKKKPNHIFRIVSCSGIIPLKRVHILYGGINTFAHNHPELQLEWIHFGDGPLYNDLFLYTKQKETPNLSVQLKGYVCNEEILTFYENNYVDVCLTTSCTEGGVPVALQEAQCFGVPCIGTNVGGIPEIINSKTGVILPANPDKNEIAAAIKHIFDLNPNAIREMRVESFENSRSNFNADVNFRKFSEQISAL